LTALVREKNAFWTMVFTLLLVLVTAQLVKVTNKVDETSRATQRAFVTLKGLALGGEVVESGKVRGFQQAVIWENSGTTPAKDVSAWIDTHPSNTTITAGYPFPEMSKDKPARFVIGPKAEVRTPYVEINRDIFWSIHQHTGYLYIYGSVVYHDIFPNSPKRLTEFCSEITGVDFISPIGNLKPATDLSDPAAKISISNSFCPIHNCSDEDCPDYKEKIAAVK
jgi:hypothetical protein